MKKREKYEGGTPPGLASRITLTIVVGLGWLAFLVIFLWFYGWELGISKSLAILILSILVVCLILIPVWVHWGLTTAQAWERKKRAGK
jgi:hypothetical protein